MTSLVLVCSLRFYIPLGGCIERKDLRMAATTTAPHPSGTAAGGFGLLGRLGLAGFAWSGMRVLL